MHHLSGILMLGKTINLIPVFLQEKITLSLLLLKTVQFYKKYYISRILEMVILRVCRN